MLEYQENEEAVKVVKIARPIVNLHRSNFTTLARMQSAVKDFNGSKESIGFAKGIAAELGQIDPHHRFSVLQKCGQVQVLNNDSELHYTLFDLNGHPKLQSQVISSHALHLLSTNINLALLSARQIKDPFTKVETLCDVARERIGRGEFDLAKGLLKEAEGFMGSVDDDEKSFALTSLVRVYVRCNAYRIIDTIRDKEQEIEVLIEMAKTQVSVGKKDNAKKTLNRALGALKDLRNVPPIVKMQYRIDIAKVLAKMDDNDFTKITAAVNEFVTLQPNMGSQIGLLTGLSKLLSLMKEVFNAKAAVGLIEKSYGVDKWRDRAEGGIQALIKVAKSQKKNEDLSGAQVTLREATAVLEKTPKTQGNEEYIFRSHIDIFRAYVAIENFDEAKRIREELREKALASQNVTSILKVAELYHRFGVKTKS